LKAGVGLRAAGNPTLPDAIAATTASQSAGKKELVPLRREWNFFFQALDRLAGVTNA